MKNLIAYILPLVVLISCNESEETESLDFDDFAGDTGVEEVDTIVEVVESSFDLNKKSGILRDNLSSQYESDSVDDFHIMDRYSFKEKEKLKFTFLEQVPYGKTTMLNPSATFLYYSFEDTNATYNAFYNFLDGMASEGEGGPIKLNEDVDAIKTPPMFMAVYDTMIISAEYQCEHQAHDWSDFQDSIFNIYGKRHKYLIEVGCGGPLKWK
jgi:hypothetical protein